MEWQAVPSRIHVVSDQVQNFQGAQVPYVLQRQVSDAFDGALANGNCIVVAIIRRMENLIVLALQRCDLLGVIAVELLQVKHRTNDIHVVGFIFRIPYLMLAFHQQLVEFILIQSPDIALRQRRE